MTDSSGSVTKQALENLHAIKSGEDPRADVSVERESAFSANAMYSIEGHEDIRRLFVDIVNLVEPDHPYLTDPYPADYADFEWSYCRSTSTVNARCGPREFDNVAKFYADKHRFVNDWSNERALQCLIHEATHITEGSHSEGSSHNPTFWRAMTDNVLIVRDYLEHRGGDGNYPELARVAPTIDIEAFERHAVMTPNRSMTDRRSMTVTEQREAIRQRLGAYHVPEEDL